MGLLKLKKTLSICQSGQKEIWNALRWVRWGTEQRYRGSSADVTNRGWITCSMQAPTLRTRIWNLPERYLRYFVAKVCLEKASSTHITWDYAWVQSFTFAFAFQRVYPQYTSAESRFCSLLSGESTFGRNGQILVVKQTNKTSVHVMVYLLNRWVRLLSQRRGFSSST